MDCMMNCISVFLLKLSSFHLRLARLRDFLTFLDRLELQIYNAHHGTALGVIPPTPKPVIVFVRSNKKMWDEWFARIRSRIIQGAKATGEVEIVIYNGYKVRVICYASHIL